MEQIVNKPENGVLIVPRVDKLEDGSFVTLVRRFTYTKGFISKDLLLPDGKWVNIPEGGEYPRECFLKSAMADRGSFDRLVWNWPPSKRGPYLKKNMQRVEL